MPRMNVVNWPRTFGPRLTAKRYGKETYEWNLYELWNEIVASLRVMDDHALLTEAIEDWQLHHRDEEEDETHRAYARLLKDQLDSGMRQQSSAQTAMDAFYRRACLMPAEFNTLAEELGKKGVAIGDETGVFDPYEDD